MSAGQEQSEPVERVRLSQAMVETLFKIAEGRHMIGPVRTLIALERRGLIEHKNHSPYSRFVLSERGKIAHAQIAQRRGLAT